MHRYHLPHSHRGRIRIATKITDVYSTRRLHSASRFKSPIDYEHNYLAARAEGLAA